MQGRVRVNTLSHTLTAHLQATHEEALAKNGFDGTRMPGFMSSHKYIRNFVETQSLHWKSGKEQIVVLFSSLIAVGNCDSFGAKV